MSSLPLVVLYGRKSPFYEGFFRFLSDKGGYKILRIDGSEMLGEIAKTPDFIFDFLGGGGRWKRYTELGSVVCYVGGEDMLNMKLGQGDCRVVVGNGVYGEFVQLFENDYHRALVDCVMNKPIEITPEVRWLYEVDFFEAVVRYTFFSGTAGGAYQVFGEEEKGEAVAKALWEAGKMTIKKINLVESMGEEGVGIEEQLERAQKEAKVIRWRVKTRFHEVAERVVRAYFGEIENLKRKPIPEVVKKQDKQIEVVAIEKNIRHEQGVELEKIEPKVEKVKKEEEKPLDIVSVLSKKTEIAQATTKRPEVVEKPKYENKTAPKRTWTKLIMPRGTGKIILGILAGIMLPSLVLVAWLWSGLLALQKDTEMFGQRASEGKWELIVTRNKSNIVFLGQLRSWASLIPGQEREGVLELLRLGEEGLYLQNQLEQVATLSSKVGQGVWGEKEVDWKIVVPKWQDAMLSADTGLARLEARLAGNLGWVPRPWLNMVKKYKTEVGNWRKVVHTGVEMVPVMSEIMGLDGRRRVFLVLLQNESELRATGGFIGSYGLLTFEGGKFIDFKVQDVYVADGQIKGYVEPPAPIREVLGEASWKMRDANWQPYFVAASRDVRWFYEKATGEKVDGVIGLTMGTVERILSVVGEVRVSDFGATVSKDNLYEQAQFFAEKNFFPGSTQKQSFLGQLSAQLFEEIKASTGAKQGKIVEAILDSFEARDTQMALNNQEANQILSETGWDGGLYEGKCPLENCYADYFFPVESNLGVNKANYFIKRDISMQVKLADGSIERKLKIEYENTAQSANWPAGNYKNYMRLYLPMDAQISEIIVSEPDGNRVLYDFSQISVRSYGNKKEVGFLVEVPVGKKKILEVSYRSVAQVNKQDRFSYLMYVQRQSGLGRKTSFDFSMEVGSNWSVSQVHPEAVVSEKGIHWADDFRKDISLGVELLP